MLSINNQTTINQIPHTSPNDQKKCQNMKRHNEFSSYVDPKRQSIVLSPLLISSKVTLDEAFFNNQM